MHSMNNEPLAAPEDSEFSTAQEKEQIRPAREFKGKELRPYSRGTRLLFQQVLSPNDSATFRVLAFVYIHLNPAEEMVKLCWNQEAFRLAVLAFAETLSPADEQEADRVTDEMIKADRASEVAPAGDGSGKKKRKR